jgi:hypothetical protein
MPRSKNASQRRQVLARLREVKIAWAHVYNATDEMIRKLTELRELALKRYRETVPEYEVER